MFADEHCTLRKGSECHDDRNREPVSRRDQPPRPALSRAAIVAAALSIADREGLDAVTMRRVADELDTSASALYVYIRSRDDLQDAMFDHVMAAVADAADPGGTWRERLSELLMRSIQVASGHGGLGRVALSRVPSGPNAVAITARVRALLAEGGGIPEAVIPAALDLLGLFVTAAALDRVPGALFGSEQHRDRLRWEIEVILNGLAATAGPAGR
jgi:AcrR family transcriptional regulator